ncbi:MAG: GGDEF domain-containing protein [Campylobacterales bacterium]|nr:GGDEF domain-containing protein [Campylobacterales bacterium]
MQKDDLKSLVTQMYENLLEKIDEQEDANKEQVINYLKDSVNVIATIADDDLDSMAHARAAFTNAYKELTDRSLLSYKNTNTRFEELAQMHEKTISECSMQEIDLSSITQKFNDIQAHMVDEVKKANSVISNLSNQVKILEETTNLDPLTKVYNRRALISYLDEICARDNMHYELHLLMLDIDNFKMINDTHGHVAGDKILMFIANIFRKTVRDGDKVFRYGGEEFVIVLNRLDNQDCEKISNRLLELVRESKLIYKGINLQVTMSIGATIYKQNDTPDAIVSRADKALYLAKTNGKDQMRVEN